MPRYGMRTRLAMDPPSRVPPISMWRRYWDEPHCHTYTSIWNRPHRTTPQFAWYKILHLGALSMDGWPCSWTLPTSKGLSNNNWLQSLIDMENVLLFDKSLLYLCLSSTKMERSKHKGNHRICDLQKRLILMCYKCSGRQGLLVLP